MPVIRVVAPSALHSLQYLARLGMAARSGACKVVLGAAQDRNSGAWRSSSTIGSITWCRNSHPSRAARRNRRSGRSRIAAGAAAASAATAKGRRTTDDAKRLAWGSRYPISQHWRPGACMTNDAPAGPPARARCRAQSDQVRACAALPVQTHESHHAAATFLRSFR